MILFINTAQPDLTQVKLIGQNRIIASEENRQPFRQAELLLPLIDGLLKKNRIKTEKLTGLAAVIGPGGFSSLRAGISTANALAATLRIPLIAVSSLQASDEKILLKTLANKQKKSQDRGYGRFKPLLPQYGAEPNITAPKELA